MSDWEDYGLDNDDAAFQQLVDSGDWSFDTVNRMNPDVATTNPTQESSSMSGQPQPQQQLLSHPFVSASPMSQILSAIPPHSAFAPRAGTAATHAATQQPHTPQHRRPEQPTVSTRGLAPVSEFTEDWLDPLESPRNLDRFPFMDYTREAIFDASSDWGSEGDQNLSQQSSIQQEMPAATRSRQRQSIVDLTEELTSPANPAAPLSASRKRSVVASSSGLAAKRSRHSHVDDDIEQLDLTNEAPSIEEELLQNQQQDAINSQRGSDQAGPQKIGKLTCNICLENFTNATITACGHIFCHECIMQALIASERLSESTTGRCPLCRKALSRKKQNNMIPISFMKRSAFRGRHGIPGTR